MARARAIIVFALAAILTSASARAEGLQRLTVTALTLGADTPSPKLETPFHLIITAHVRERVAQLNNLDLPILAELEDLGDEHQVTSDATGTSYRETITVVAHHTGAITIEPVTLDAVDARDGQAKRYSSNTLTLNIGAGPLEPLRSARDAVMDSVMVVARVAFWLFCVGSAALLCILLFRRRRPIPPRTPVALVLPPAVPVEPRSRKARLYDAFLTLRADPTRANAMRVRAMVRRMIGAGESETLADVMTRPAANDPAIAPLLRTLERAAFTYEGDLPTAIGAALRALEQSAA